MSLHAVRELRRWSGVALGLGDELQRPDALRWRRRANPARGRGRARGTRTRIQELSQAHHLLFEQGCQGQARRCWRLRRDGKPSRRPQRAAQGEPAPLARSVSWEPGGQRRRLISRRKAQELQRKARSRSNAQGEGGEGEGAEEERQVAGPVAGSAPQGWEAAGARQA